MATLIGIVRTVVGEVFAQSADGSKRLLTEGDRVFAGEQLLTGAGGAIAITLVNGGELTMGRDSSLLLEPRILAEAAGDVEVQVTHQAGTATPTQLDSVAELQRAIAAGQDPTRSAEPTAAGPGAGTGGTGDGGGGTSFVLLTETGERVAPEIGYPTGPLTFEPLTTEVFPSDIPEDNEPSIIVEHFEDASGRVIVDRGQVDESALPTGTNPDSPTESAYGRFVIDSPDGIGAVQVLDVNGNWVSVTGGGSVQGQYGTLVVNPDYTWTYQLDSNTLDHDVTNAVGLDDMVADGFQVRVIDSDGDVSLPAALQVDITDDGPVIHDFGVMSGAGVVVDESVGLAGSSSGEAGQAVPNDEAAAGAPAAAIGYAQVAAAALFVVNAEAGADLEASHSYALSVSAEGVDSGLLAIAGDSIRLFMDGSDVVGRAGASEVLRISVDADSGDVTLVQYQPIDHGADGNDHDALASMLDGVIGLTLTIVDNDGDTAVAGALDIGSLFGFEDDGPLVVLTEDGMPVLTVDDSTLGVAASGEFAAQFAADFGSDGMGLLEYSLGLNPGASGLVDSLSGDAVVLSMDGTDVVGMAAGVEVLRISVDADSGEVTLTQSRAVMHDDPADADEAGSPAMLDGGLVILNATATDADGDTSSASMDISSAFAFRDDGPVIELVDAALPSLTTDDTAITDSASASFASLFASSFGNDGFKDIDDNDVEDADAISYQLSLNAGVSGLVDSLSGDAVLLSMDGSDIVGMAAGQEVIRISVDAASGEVSLTQSRAVMHDDPSDPDEAGSPAMLGSGIISLTATITDADGDSDSASLDISSAFAFRDDGPSIEVQETEMPTLETDDTAITDSDSASFAYLFIGSFGTDGFKDADNNDIEDADALSYQLALNAGVSGLVDSLSGDAVLLSMDGGDIVGMAAGAEVLRIHVDAASGEVTLTQARAVMHDDPSDPDEAGSPAMFNSGLISLTATITDADGDTDSASVDISDVFAFRDDGPSIDLADARIPTLVTDDSDITDSDSASFAALFSSSFGNDGPLDVDDNDVPDANAIAYALDVTSPVSGLVDSLSGDAVLLSMDGNDIVGMAAGAEVLRIQVNADTGEVTLIQARAVMHDDPSDPDEAGSPAVLAGGSISLSATITDADGDTDQATLDISAAFTFRDDGPSIEVNQNAIPVLVTDDSDITDSDSASFAALFSSSFGNDGPLDVDDNDVPDANAIAYALDVTSPVSGLVDSLSGDAVLLSMDGNDIVGMADGQEVLRIQVNADTGEVTLIQARAVMHDDPSDPDEAGSPAVLSGGSISLSATITDADGDTDQATLDISAAFTFRDDGPSIEVNQNAIPVLVTDDSNIVDSDSASFAALFSSSFGNDGPLDVDDNDVPDANAIAYALDVTSPVSGLVDSLSGDAVLLSMDGADIVGMADGEEVLRISVNADTGEVTLIQARAVMHDDPNDPDEAGSPAVLAGGSISLSATITDADGDTDQATLDISAAFTFRDDGPSIEVNQNAIPVLVTDDSDITDSDSASFAALFSSSFGNDGPLDVDDNDVPDANAIAYALDVTSPVSGLVDSLSGDAVLLSMDGNDIVGMADGQEVLRIQVNADTGEVTLIQARAVMHDDPSDPDEAGSPAVLAGGAISLSATITDADGDTDTASLDISAAFTFRDDGPSIDLADAELPVLVTDDSDITDSDSASFAALFSSSFGNDGPLDVDDNDVPDANAIAYALDVTSPVSGLVDSLSGDAVLLSMDGNDIVGMADGQEVLRIQVNADTGEVTLIQARAVMHDDPSDPDEAGSPAVLAGGAISLTATITDADGDTDTASLDISAAFTFRDDGPSIEVNQNAIPILVTDDSNIVDSDSASFAALFSSSFGNDGPLDVDDNDVPDANAIAYALDVTSPVSGLVDSLSGDAVLLSMDGNDIVGMAAGAEVLRIQVNADTGEVTLIQARAVMHDDPSDPDEAGSPAVLSGGSISLSATITDADGDTDQATLDISAAFTFRDDGPSIEVNQNAIPVLVTDDSNIVDSDSASFAALFSSSFGNDGPLDVDDNDVPDANAIAYALDVTSPVSGLVDSLSGDAVLLSMDGNDIVGMADGQEVLRIQVNADTGEVTLIQARAVMHDDPSDPDEAGSPAVLAGGAISLSATITDADGDTDQATLDISAAFTFRDDGPSIEVNQNAIPVLVTDDSNIVDSDSASFAALFSSSFGNDGPLDVDDNDVPDANAIAYALDVTSPVSGLVDSLSGDAVLLSMDGNDIVGMAAGAEVLRIQVNADTGEVTLIQARAVMHDDPSDPDEAGSPAVLAGGAISLSATITDADGDTDQATLDISAAFTFRDDGPSIEVNQNAIPVLVTDDSNITDSDSASFASLFTGQFGEDGFKDADDNDIEDADAISYELGLNAGPSGLVDSLSGDAVVLSLVGGDVVGMAAGQEVIRISVEADTGEVSLTQSRAVMHDDPSDPDEAGSPAMLNGGLVTLTATITDADGDTDDAMLDISEAFTFRDDGPNINTEGVIPTLVVDDSDFATDATASFADLFAGMFGNDGPLDADDNDIPDPDAVSYSLSVTPGFSGLIDSLSGDPVILSMDGDDIVGMAAGQEVLRISVNDVDGSITLDQSRAVMHDDPADPDEAGSPAVLGSGLISLTATITDADGDTDTATLDISGAFAFRDDGPHIELADARIPTLVTDDSFIVDSDSASFASLFVGSFGNDGPLDVDDNDVPDANAIAYALDVTSPVSGLVDSLSGDAVLLSMDGNDIVGMADGEEVLRISVNANTGEVSLTQSRAVMHDDPSDPDEAGSPAVLAGGAISLTATITDADGDTDQATLDISAAFTFRDDGPSIEVNQNAIPILVTDDSNIVDSDSASFASLFSSAFGTDGPLDVDDDDVPDVDAITYELSLNAGPSGLVDSLSGDAVVLSMDGDDIVGMAAGAEVIRISVDSDGLVSLTQSRSVMHDDPSDPQEAGSPAMLNGGLIELTATITDADGDSDEAMIDISSAFTFLDDGPSIGLSGLPRPVLVVDETDFATNATASFAGLFTGDFGTDGPLDVDDNDVADANAITYELSLNAGASGLVDSLSGDDVVLSMSGGDIVGMAAGQEVLRISVDANSGSITLDQSRAVMHDDPTDPDEALSPAGFNLNLISLTATITDADGDQAEQTLDISQSFAFRDDGPDVSLSGLPRPVLTVDETNFAINASASFASLFFKDFGNDGPLDVDDNNVPDPGALVYSLQLNAGDSGLIDSLSGDAVVLNLLGNQIIGSADGQEVLRISVNAQTGLITLDQSRAVMHDDPSDPDEALSPAGFNLGLITLTATITDADGDQDSQSLDISQAFAFEDDGPSISLSGVARPLLMVDDSDFATDATASFASLFSSSFGNDGPLDLDDNNVPDAGALVYQLSLNAGASGLVDSLSGDAVVLSMDGNDIVGRADGHEVLRISVDAATGSITLDQSRAVMHDDPADPDEAISPAVFNLGLITLSATITDADGDSASATLDISSAFAFRDDGPSIQLSGLALPSLVVDDSDFATDAAASFADQFISAFGNDGPLDLNDDDVADTDAVSYSLVLNGANSGLVDSLSGQAVMLALVGNDIVGTAAGQEVLRISVNADTGEVSFDQSRAVLHDDPNDPDEALTPEMFNAGLISLMAVVTDADGDTASATRDITGAFEIRDDGPSAFEPEHTLLVDQTPSINSVSGELRFAGHTGNDGLGNVVFNITEGDPALDGNGYEITLGDEPLYLYYGADQTQLVAMTSGGAVGYTITLDPAGDSYTVTTYGVLSNNTSIVISNLSGVGSAGHLNFKALIDVGGTEDDVLISSTTGPINSSASDIAIDNQWISTGENIRFDFVNNLVVNDLSSIGFDFGTHNLRSNFKQTIYQVQGNGNTASIVVMAIIADSDYVFGSSDAGETHVDLDPSDIRVYDENGVNVTGSVTITDSGTAVVIEGLYQGWSYEINSATDFSAVYVEGAPGTTEFALGQLSYSTVTAEEPIDLSYQIVASDADGDWVSSTLTASLYPAADAVQGDNLDNVIPGTDGHDVLFGNGGADNLSGLLGDDVLSGGAGDDTLLGGLGDDTMAGGEGADTFIYGSGETGMDHILDFHPGEDVLDLTDLLVGVDGSLSNADLANSLTGYLDIAFGTTTTITVDPDAGGGLPAGQVIVLDGVDLSAAYGTTDAATLITSMLDDGSLKVS